MPSIKGTFEGVVCVFRPAMFIIEKVLRRWLGSGWASPSGMAAVMFGLSCSDVDTVLGRRLEDPRVGGFEMQSVTVLGMPDGTDSAFSGATGLWANSVFARLGSVVLFAVPADFGVVGTVFDALLLALDRWAFVMIGQIGTVLVVSLVLVVFGVDFTLIGAPGIDACCEGAWVPDLSEAAGSVAVAVAVDDLE